MAAPAEFMGYWPCKLASFMAFPAVYFRMLCNQAKFGEVVIETLSSAITLPAAGIVTLVALTAELHALERIAVGPRVTAPAAVKRQSFKAKRLRGGKVCCSCALNLHLARNRPRVLRMAFGTRNLLVHAGERKRRARMAES